MALTDAQYKAWLSSATSIRTALVEVVAGISGVDTTLYLSSRNYVDGTANRAYTACVAGGLTTRETINLDGTPSIGYGDIEISNPSGERDAWLDYVWSNRAANVYVGDPTWPRSDFRLVFSGVLDDIGVRSIDRLTLRLRDKLARLNAPVTEEILGGSTANKDKVLPVTLGECFNVTPLLTDQTNLHYTFHHGPTSDAAERVIEVRDNGAPITSWGENVSSGYFEMYAAPVGQITATVQGVVTAGNYYSDISRLVQKLVTDYGPASTRFTSGDLDATQLAAFEAACPQDVGVYLTDRSNVLQVCQELAGSVGANVVCTSTGLLRLIRVALPASGTPTAVTAADMERGSLTISSRPAVQASVVLGYSKNWTPQSQGLASGLPASSAALLGAEFKTVYASSAATDIEYKRGALAPMQETLLIEQTAASTEAQRRLDLWKTQRAVYTATCLPHLLLTELGDPVTLTHSRFGLSSGKTGMVVSVERDWLRGRITLGVLA